MSILHHSQHNHQPKVEPGKKNQDSAAKVPADQVTLNLEASERAIFDPTAASPQDILRLQNAAGNQAVSGLIQAKLRVGPVGDAYEQEADRMAEKVVHSAPTGQVQREAAPEEEEELQMKPAPGRVPTIQRDHAPEEEELQMKPAGGQAATKSGFAADEETEQRLQSLRGSGQPLPKELRSEMEAHLGADFSGVRLHTNNEAGQLNRRLAARAFTHGKDIYLDNGEYNPASHEGKRLLAHELTHVVQQTGKNSSTAKKDSSYSTASISTAAPSTHGGVVQRDVDDDIKNQFGIPDEKWDKMPQLVKKSYREKMKSGSTEATESKASPQESEQKISKTIKNQFGVSDTSWKNMPEVVKKSYREKLKSGTTEAEESTPKPRLKRTHAVRNLKALVSPQTEKSSQTSSWQKPTSPTQEKGSDITIGTGREISSPKNPMPLPKKPDQEGISEEDREKQSKEMRSGFLGKQAKSAEEQQRIKNAQMSKYEKMAYGQGIDFEKYQGLNKKAQEKVLQSNAQGDTTGREFAMQGKQELNWKDKAKFWKWSEYSKEKDTSGKSHWLKNISEDKPKWYDPTSWKTGEKKAGESYFKPWTWGTSGEKKDGNKPGEKSGEKPGEKQPALSPAEQEAKQNEQMTKSMKDALAAKSSKSDEKDDGSGSGKGGGGGGGGSAQTNQDIGALKYRIEQLEKQLQELGKK